MVQGETVEIRKGKREMTALLDIFRRNWGLKLIALVLALVIYYSMRNTSEEDGVTQGIFMKGTVDGGSGK